jgi:hypothetical protein
MVDGIEVRHNFSIDEIRARLFHHELFFAEFFRDENLIAINVFDEKLTAGECIGSRV